MHMGVSKNPLYDVYVYIYMYIYTCICIYLYRGRQREYMIERKYIVWSWYMGVSKIRAQT